MPVVATVDGVKIFFYANDHAPPRFQGLFAEYEVVIEIDPLAMREGALPRTKLASLLDWAATRKPQLQAPWLETQAKRKPEPIL